VSPPWSRGLERLKALVPLEPRSIVTFLVLLSATAFFGWVVNRHYPIEQWLFFRYAVYWIATGAWLAGALGVGHLVVTRTFGLRLATHEATVTALAVGLLAFEMAMLVLGMLHAFRSTAFFAVPIAFLGGGFAGLRELYARWRTLFVRARPRLDGLGIASIAFGFLVFAMIYFAALSPENVQFDSRWKHMSLAEDWVAHGGLRRRDEGWLFSARPHMTSLLYTWAFLLPGALLFDRMLLCAHLELAIFFVTTVVGIPALVRRLVPRADPRVVWAARFLFPGVLLYDSSLSAGTDHIGALFGVPAAFLLFKVWKRLELRPTLLLATVLAGGVLVKETIALMLVPFPALAVVMRAKFFFFQKLRGRATLEEARNAWISPLAAAGLALALTTPLWLENLVWYGDPLYPSLHRFFSPRPWSEDAAYRFAWGYQDAQLWAPSRDLDGLLETLRALFMYSFEPHDWKKFHRDVPVFGSLFTLLVFCLPFCRGTRRLWVFVAWIHVAIFAWYSVHHQDRYLQGILPLMAAATAGIMILVVRQNGPLVRVALGVLVSFQLVWGGDVYFFQTHAMAKSPPKKSIDLLSSGFERKGDSRFGVQNSFQAIGKNLPKRSRLLLHDTNINLGTGVTTVLDNPGWQYGIEYGKTKSPVEMHELFRKLGVTHVFGKTEKSKGTDSIAGDIRFYDYLRRRSANSRSVSGGLLVEVGDKPEGPFDDSVGVLSCGRDYESGLYRVEDLSTPPFGPRTKNFPKPRAAARMPEDAADLIRQSEFVVADPKCTGGSPPGLNDEHTLLIRRNAGKAIGAYEIWARGKVARTERVQRGESAVPEDETDGP
jgi:hypothetical protein